MKNNINKNKNFFTILFVSLAILFILITYSAVKQQQSTRSRAATVAGSCIQQGSCLLERTLCKTNATAIQDKCCSNLVCNPEDHGVPDYNGACRPPLTNTPTPTSGGGGHTCSATQGCGSAGCCANQGTGATCIDTYSGCSTCNGTLLTNYCPGDSFDRCCVPLTNTPTPTPTTAPSTCSGLTQTQCNATENATNCRWLKDRAECVQECNKYTIQTCDLTYCVVNTNFCRVQCRYLYSNTICANQTGRCEWCTASNSCINAGGSCGITNTPTPTRTPTPTPIGPTNTPTPTPSGTTSIDLELKLSFQGITADFPPEALTNDTLNVKVSIIDDTQNYIPVNNETVTVYADESRIWTGQITITNIPLAELNQNKFYMLIKGPKHIQKKICDSAPAEGESGYYSCQFGNIAFQQGLNTFDFTGIRLLAGDLPINGTQDGNINAEDVAMIYNNFLSTDPSVLAVADLDLNGIIEMHDWSLMIESLEVKYDEK